MFFKKPKRSESELKELEQKRDQFELGKITFNEYEKWYKKWLLNQSLSNKNCLE